MSDESLVELMEDALINIDDLLYVQMTDVTKTALKDRMTRFFRDRFIDDRFVLVAGLNTIDERVIIDPSDIHIDMNVDHAAGRVDIRLVTEDGLSIVLVDKIDMHITITE